MNVNVCYLPSASIMKVENGWFEEKFLMKLNTGRATECLDGRPSCGGWQLWMSQTVQINKCSSGVCWWRGFADVLSHRCDWSGQTLTLYSPEVNKMLSGYGAQLLRRSIDDTPKVSSNSPCPTQPQVFSHLLINQEESYFEHWWSDDDTCTSRMWFVYCLFLDSQQP